MILNEGLEYRIETMTDIYKREIIQRIQMFENNKTRVAISLGITLRTLYNKLSEFNLEHYITDEKGRRNDKQRTHKNTRGLPRGENNGPEWSVK